MANNEKTGKLGLASWTLWQLAKAPAAWAGAAAGLACGIPMASETTMGGAIGFGTMIAIAAGFLAQGIYITANNLRAHHSTRATTAEKKERQELENLTVEKMNATGLDADADVLKKMLAARDEIVKHSQRSDVSPERSSPTLDLVFEITRAALLRAEELADLKRRQDDPLLSSAKNATKRIKDCQADLVHAYKAVADARTRILLHKELTPDALLKETRGVTDGGLSALTGQLEEETAVLRGVDRRMSYRYTETEEESSEDEIVNRQQESEP